MRSLLTFLEAQEDLKNDKQDLRELGLTEEEIAGYEDFFLENYYISPYIKE